MSARPVCEDPRLAITGTIAVCTRNRAGVLAQCLECLDAQLVDPHEVEVLVVDNGSSDGTPDLVATWAAGGPGRRSLIEPRVGLSHARNAALAASDAAVVLFVDDDALVPATWARAHLAAYADDDRVGTVGGPIGLEWPAGRPQWISDEVACWFSALDLGDDAGPYPNTHGPFGTNMSVRRLAALGAGGYDPKLGRSGRRLRSGEEPDLSRRLVAAGWTMRYEPAAAVVQQVTPERLERRWLLRRGWAQGAANARLAVRAGAAPTRRDLARLAADEVRETSDALRRRRSGEQDDTAALVLALVHARTAVEFGRSLVVPQGPQE
jgi:cellulose synthase/poly-beta-1,6-N-acetylglucosamine synthase-like glycosyltransferase